MTVTMSHFNCSYPRQSVRASFLLPEEWTTVHGGCTGNKRATTKTTAKLNKIVITIYSTQRWVKIGNNLDTVINSGGLNSRKE